MSDEKNLKHYEFPTPRDGVWPKDEDIHEDDLLESLQKNFQRVFCVNCSDD